MDIKDKVAIVTGASSGIGLATAKLLSKEGAKVVLASRSIEKLNNSSKEIPNSFAIKTDMTKEEDIKEMVRKTVDKFGRVDILINNAGRGYDASIEEIDPKLFRDIYELDVVAPLIAMQQVIPVMRKQGEGAIVNVSSGTALMSIPNMSAYSSSKRALVGISLTANQELKEDNIYVGVIYPYITATDFEKNTIKSQDEEWEGDGGDLAPADPPEFVAEKIVEGIKNESPEIFVHDWMKNE